MAQHIAQFTEWLWSGPIWSDHPNGKNYLAKIVADENEHTGVARQWQPRSKGKTQRAFVWRQMAAGDAFEIGSSDVNETGTVVAQRVHGVIVQIDASGMDYISYANAKEAIKEARDRVNTMPALRDTPSMLQREARDIRNELARLNHRLTDIRAQLKEMGELSNDMYDGVTVDTSQMVNEMIGDPVPEIGPVKVSLLENAKSHLAAPAPPIVEDDDDEEEELTPAQLAALR